MDYERLLTLNEIHQLPIKRLLVTAEMNAQRKSESDKSYFFCIRLGEKEYAVLDVKKNSQMTLLMFSIHMICLTKLVRQWD